MKFTIVVPTVEGVHSAFDDCLPSWIRHESGAANVVVVDDGSAPSVQERTRSECERRGFRFLGNPVNRGYAHSVNRGISAAAGDAVLLVNSDIHFTGAVLQPIRERFLSDRRIGVVGGLLLYPDGRVQHGGIVHRGRYFSHRGYRERVSDAPEVERGSFILGCSGALLALRREMLAELGPLDETLPLAFEDVELCLRAWSNGWRVFYEPWVRAVHEEGTTRGASLPAKLGKSLRWTLREFSAQRTFRRRLRGLDLDAAKACVVAANRERGPEDGGRRREV